MEKFEIETWAELAEVAVKKVFPRAKLRFRFDDWRGLLLTIEIPIDGSREVRFLQQAIALDYTSRDILNLNICSMLKQLAEHTARDVLELKGNK